VKPALARELTGRTLHSRRKHYPLYYRLSYQKLNGMNKQPIWNVNHLNHNLWRTKTYETFQLVINYKKHSNNS
jgi:hypothetical protein